MRHVRTWLAALAALFVMALPAAAEAPTEIKGATTVNAEQIIELVSSTADLVVLDTRKPEDFAAGHLENAVRLIDTDVTAETLGQHVASKDTPVLFYCNGLKCGRAANAVEKALGFGYSKVFYYALGMEEWNKQGLPVAR